LIPIDQIYLFISDQAVARAQLTGWGEQIQCRGSPRIKVGYVVAVTAIELVRHSLHNS
jgi:hypothetical protein